MAELPINCCRLHWFETGLFILLLYLLFKEVGLLFCFWN